MFYNHNLMNNTLGIAWCYANQQKVTNDNAELPKICSTLEKLVNHDSTQRGRLSLRTSTLLLNGTARLYKEELDKLYQDCIQLDNRMLFRRSPNTSLTDDNHSSSTDGEHSINSKRRNRRRRKSLRRTSKNNSQKSVTEERRSEGSIRDFKSFETGFRNSDLQNVSVTKFNATKTSNAEVQTTKSYIANIRQKYKCNRKPTNLETEVPMGIIMVYNDHLSRLPSKLICANLNKNVKLL